MENIFDILIMAYGTSSFAPVPIIYACHERSWLFKIFGVYSNETNRQLVKQVPIVDVLNTSLDCFNISLSLQILTVISL